MHMAVCSLYHDSFPKIRFFFLSAIYPSILSPTNLYHDIYFNGRFLPIHNPNKVYGLDLLYMKSALV